MRRRPRVRRRIVVQRQLNELDPLPLRLLRLGVTAGGSGGLLLLLLLLLPLLISTSSSSFSYLQRIRVVVRGLREDELMRPLVDDGGAAAAALPVFHAVLGQVQRVLVPISTSTVTLK